MIKRKQKRSKRSFVNKVLGSSPVSSHPEHYNNRRWFYIIAGMIPFAIGLIAMVLLSVWGVLKMRKLQFTFEAFVNFIQGLVDWMTTWGWLLTGLMVLGVGFGICGLLIVLAGRYSEFGNRKRIVQNSKWPWWLIIGTSIGIGLVGVLVDLNSSSSQIDLVAQAFLVGPILITILVLGPLLDMVHPEGKGMQGRKIFFWFMAIIITAYLAALFSGWTRIGTETIQGWISDDQWATLKSTEFGQNYFPDKKTQIGSALDDLIRSFVVITNMFLLTSWLLWRRPADEESEESASKGKNKKQSVFAKFTKSIRRIFGVKEKTKEEELLTQQNWLDSLLNLEEMPDGCIDLRELTDEERGLNDMESSRPCESSEYRSFFGDIIPTEDQDELISLIIERSNRNSANLITNEIHNPDDILVQGFPGSGRKTWLSAAAVADAVRRGKKVLVLSPDAESAASLATQMRKVLSNSRVDKLLYIARLDKVLLRAIEANNLAALPDILVATRPEMEKAFFEELNQAEPAKTAAIRMIDSIFVTDIMDFTSEDRLHIPFLLGKLRLINQVAGEQIRTVVLAPHTLDKQMCDWIGRRLFSPLPTYKWHTRKLRAWRRPTDTELVVEISNLGDAIKSITKILLLSGQSVIVLRRSWEQSRLISEQAKLLPAGVPPERLRVVSSIKDIHKSYEDDEEQDEDESNKKNKSWCILIHRASGSSQSFSIPALPDFDKTAIIHLGLPETRVINRVVQLPILGSSKSEGMLAQSISSIVPYLETGSPAHRNIWRHFGVPEVGRLTEIGDDDQVIEGFSFKIDPPESISGSEDYFPWIQLESYSGHHELIGCLENQSSLYHLRLRKDTELIVAKRKLSSEEETRRIASWSAEGQAMQTQDLASANLISINVSGTKMLPRDILIDQNNITKIESYPSGDLLGEKEYPIWSGNVVVREGTVAIPAMQISSKNISWHNLREDAAKQRSVIVHADWSLDGIFADNASMQKLASSVEFTYSAIASFLVLGSAQPESIEVAGIWAIDCDDSNGRVFWPEMTSALMSGLRVCAPDAASLGRLLAFRCAKNPQVAYVLITELPEYSGTMEELFRLIFGSNVLGKQFFDQARKVIRNVSGEQPSDEVFRILATSALQSMGKFNEPLDCNAAQEILNALLEGIRSEDDIPLV